MIWLYVLCFGVGALTGATLMSLMVASREWSDREEKEYEDIHKRSDNACETPGEGL